MHPPVQWRTDVDTDLVPWGNRMSSFEVTGDNTLWIRREKDGKA